tara:strand:- start:804 stop:1190 length:387 start_codon:yes stop_codon:yes gene_type:complete
MEILGIGIDIVENQRIEKSLKNKMFISRVFNENEIIRSKKKNNKINFYAKKFSAKEAFVKALGVGFRNGINFKDITITNNFNGKPIILINSKIKNFIKKKLTKKKINIHLSISDENKYSVSFVVIEIK